MDLEAEAPRVLEAVEGRDTLAAVRLLETLPEPARASVEAVAMDLSAADAAASRQVLPQADVVHDRCHISKLLGEAARPPAVHSIPRRRLGGQGAPRRAPAPAGPGR